MPSHLDDCFQGGTRKLENQTTIDNVNRTVGGQLIKTIVKKAKSCKNIKYLSCSREQQRIFGELLFLVQKRRKYRTHMRGKGQGNVLEY